MKKNKIQIVHLSVKPCVHNWHNGDVIGTSIANINKDLAEISEKIKLTELS